MAHRGIFEYFVLINYKTNERLLCSWQQDQPDFWGRKVYFIGIGGLGGYRYMIEKGFVDRRFEKYIEENKIWLFIRKQIKKGIKVYNESYPMYNSLPSR